jgi:hypothetical protein
MKRRLVYTFGLIVFGMIAFDPRPADAQTVAPGPYYANPSWDQTLACTTLATCPRFIVLSNMSSDAVLDRETGLVWEKSPSTSTPSWANAQILCNEVIVGNRRGWRVPTFQELASLVDPSVAFPGPALPSGHPFTNVGSFAYWSATTNLDTSNAWAVSFGFGTVGVSAKPGAHRVWCVRGGQGVDPQ